MLLGFSGSALQAFADPGYQKRSYWKENENKKRQLRTDHNHGY